MRKTAFRGLTALIATTVVAACSAVALAGHASASTAVAAGAKSHKLKVTANPDLFKSVRASSVNGGRSGDFSLDGRQDILARVAGSGTLQVYPHAASNGINGVNTYTPAVPINYGW